MNILAEKILDFVEQNSNLSKEQKISEIEKIIDDETYYGKSPDRKGGFSYFCRIYESFHKFIKFTKDRSRKSNFYFRDLDGSIYDYTENQPLDEYYIECIDLKDDTPLQRYDINDIKRFKKQQIEHFNSNFPNDQWVVILTKFNGQKSNIVNLKLINEFNVRDKNILERLKSNIEDLKHYEFKIYTKDLINSKDNKICNEWIEKIHNAEEMLVFLSKKKFGYEELAKKQLSFDQNFYDKINPNIKSLLKID